MLERTRPRRRLASGAASIPTTRPARWLKRLTRLLLALSLLPGAPALEAGVHQAGTSLSIGLNAGGTLGDGGVALSFDRDGAEGRPAVEVIRADSGLERFALRFTSSKTITLSNTAPPGVTQAILSLTDTSSTSAFTTEGTLTVDTLRLRQRTRFIRDGRTLSLTVTLYNLGSRPITGLSWMRAANPDPDLELQGVAGTLDDVVETDEGPLAIASGAASSLTLAVGVLDAPARVGFCYRCTSPESQPYDSEGRAEDWDLVAVVTPGDLAPGASISFTLLYLAAPTPEEALADWAAARDRDGDGVSGLDGDCDDDDPAVRPGALEQCDGEDDDCDGTIDEGTPCGDDDGDGATEQQGDCDDADPTRRPGAAEGVDRDGDGVLEGDGVDNDCDGTIDEGSDRFDDDQDGLSELEGDCDDSTAAVHPGADEAPYDGVDQDCDGIDVTDVDGDGHPGGPDGDDCDDNRLEVHPGAEERQDGLDNDCDGLVDAPFISAGAVIITEILFDPGAVADRSGEYLELFNASAFTLELRGWTVENAAGQRHTFDPARGLTRLEPGELLLLGPEPDAALNGGLAIDYPWSGLTLANGADRVVLRMGDLEIDAVAWDGGVAFPDPTGASIQLDPGCFSAEDNDDGACWCASSTAWTDGGDRGTPGGANEVCPPAPGTDADDDGAVAREAGGDDCDDGDPSIHPGALEVPYDGIDQDCDGTDLRDGDGDGLAAMAQGGTDCDDTDGAVYPGAPEDGVSGDGSGDGLDNDCDGRIDEDTLDVDDDGDGSSEREGDCDDDDPARHPGAEERPDGIDNDCDGAVDPRWTDGDRDGTTPAEGDCDDTDGSRHPGAPELPDGIDQDCDGSIDEQTAASDDDGDGFSEQAGDCDDRHREIHPGALDHCGDGIDQDCHGGADTDCAGGCGGCTQTGSREGAPAWRGHFLWMLLASRVSAARSATAAGQPGRGSRVPSISAFLTRLRRVAMRVG